MHIVLLFCWYVNKNSAQSENLFCLLLTPFAIRRTAEDVG